MTRVTPRDRDRAVRRLSAITGALTAGSLAMTGGLMALAKHETEAHQQHKNSLKVQPASMALSAQTAPRQGTPTPCPTPRVHGNLA